MPLLYSPTLLRNSGGAGFGVGIATTAPPRLSTPALEVSKLHFRLRLSLAWRNPQYAISDGGLAVGSFPTCGRALCVGVCLNERAVDNGKNLYVIWWWNGKKFVTLLYRFGVAPFRKRAMKRESGENPEQTELLYASTFNPIACSLPC